MAGQSGDEAVDRLVLELSTDRVAAGICDGGSVADPKTVDERDPHEANVPSSGFQDVASEFRLEARFVNSEWYDRPDLSLGRECLGPLGHILWKKGPVHAEGERVHRADRGHTAACATGPPRTVTASCFARTSLG